MFVSQTLGIDILELRLLGKKFVDTDPTIKLLILFVRIPMSPTSFTGEVCDAIVPNGVSSVTNDKYRGIPYVARQSSSSSCNGQMASLEPVKLQR
jgi:hypothetical protein